MKQEIKYAHVHILKHGGVFMIYLDNSATSYPKPERVIEAVAECMAGWCANPGRAGHDNAMKSSQAIYQTRKTIAEFLGGNCKPDEIILTSNCTEALNTGIKGFLKRGDHVITTMMEHNSVLRPLYALKKEGIETSMLKCSAEGYPEKGSLIKALKKNTRMIICTLSSNVTGTVMPVEEIGEFAQKHGIVFMIDAAQGLGSIPFDLGSCRAQMVAGSGHKSLLGPQGTGFLYLNKDIKLRTLKEGGTGTESTNLNQPEKSPERFEAGTLNVPGAAGLNEGIRYIMSEGINNIRKRECEITGYLQDEIRKTDGVIIYGPDSCEKKTAVIAFNIEGIDCEEAASLLNERYGIAVRSGYHCAPVAHKVIGTEKTGCIRISPGIFTTYDDILKTAAAIKEIAENKV